MNTLAHDFARPSLLICCAVLTLAQVPFKPSKITSASDVQFPISSVATGIVVVDVSLDSKGDVTGVDVPRGIVSLTSVATSAVRTWKYKPASSDSTARASVLRVAFAFRPHAIMAAPPYFDPLLEQQEDTNPEAKTEYTPPGVVAATYPAYPIDAGTVGAVVVQIKVNADGKIGDVKAIRAFNPFTQFALEAAKKWQFRAATLNGEPVASYLAIAFVFSPPVISD